MPGELNGKRLAVAVRAVEKKGGWVGEEEEMFGYEPVVVHVRLK